MADSRLLGMSKKRGESHDVGNRKVPERRVTRGRVRSSEASGEGQGETPALTRGNLGNKLEVGGRRQREFHEMKMLRGH